MNVMNKLACLILMSFSSSVYCLSAKENSIPPEVSSFQVLHLGRLWPYTKAFDLAEDKHFSLPGTL